jgi:hypothetical protein
MRRRCYDKNTKAYPNYGGRGIAVCDQWLDYETFKEWSLNNGYSGRLTIDRINNSGNYSPENCRWVDHKTQANNKDSNVKVAYNGEKRNLAEVSEELGIKHKTLWSRVRQNIDESQLFEAKVIRRNEIRVSVNGSNESISSLSEKTGLSKSAIGYRIKQGLDGADLLKENQFPYKHLTINGRTQTVAEWSRESGIPRNTICGRVDKGLPEHLWLSKQRINASKKELI